MDSAGLLSEARVCLAGVGEPARSSFVYSRVFRYASRSPIWSGSS